MEEQRHKTWSLKKILVLGALLVFVPWAFVSAMTPQTTSAPKTETTSTPQPEKVKSTESKVVSEKSAVPFETETKSDPSLPLGQTKVTREGVNGEKETRYTITYTDGVQTNKQYLDEKITVSPTSKIIVQGTYAAPKCGSGYYINAYGNCVKSPSSSPSGASARCKDGTYSYSQTRSGTCSHHGGVAEWL